MSCIIVKNNAGQSTLLVEYLSEKGFGKAIVAPPSIQGVKTEAQKGRYRYAVIDAKLDGADGFELARTIKKTSPGTYCVICIDPNNFNPDFLVRFDISGYLAGNHSLKELMECFAFLNEGYRFICSNIRLKLSWMDFIPEEDEVFSGNANLSRQEKKILQLLTCGKNTSEIAEELFLSPHTINNHKTKIRNKLNLTSNRQLITYAVPHRKSIL